MAHILVIDDEADICCILTEFLTLEGHTIDTAENGKAGLRLAEQNQYDLIITDIVMPEMDGLEFLTAIKEKFPEIGIIVMSGGTLKMENGLLLSMNRDMKAYKAIAKPISFKELKAAVNMVLEG